MNHLASLCLALAGLGILCTLAECSEEIEQDINKIDWWKKTNFYHIYIRSFKDTDGNGQGDLRGVIEKLDYLRMIGVETLLLSPFYSSPMKDGGYDIDDYEAIAPLYGSMQDFENLLAELKQRSMKLVVDFVPNHSSNQHRWFKCSERALIDPENCAKYKDYYVWSNSTRFNNSRPTNWISLFDGKTAWRWSPVRKEFYLHQFLAEQPDLNLRNPLVRDEFKNIARFWLRKGVDGLRVDAVLHFMEDFQMRDEPQDPSWQPHWDPYDRLLHIYTRSMSESSAISKDWLEVANEPEFGGNRVVIVEAYDTIRRLVELYGLNSSERYCDFPFNFELFQLNQHNMSPRLVEKLATDWLNATHQLGWPDVNGARDPWTCWVTANHDNTRPVNRVGEYYADAYRFIAYLLPGVPVAYYGDEIGLYDSDLSKVPQRTLNEGEPTRLAFRGPMAWDASEPCANFSINPDTWMPMHSNYKQINVESMMQHPNKNHLKNFIQLQKVRRDNLQTLTFGGLSFLHNRPLGESPVLAMLRSHAKFGSILLVVNFDAHKSHQLSLVAKQGDRVPTSAQVLLVDKLWSHELREGKQVDLEGLSIGPSQAVVFKY